jgi:peptidoglycan/xylan/chitin deacetylase (PgdA/CDA1 family)
MMFKSFKQGTLAALKRAGVFKIVENSRWRRERLLILAYHGISLEDEHLWNSALYMPPANFRGRLKLLKQGGYKVLPLAEALHRLYADDLPEKSVAITFDDGNYDFYKQAYPIIKENNFPVTVYLSTYYSQYGRPVFDVMCSYILWKGCDAVFYGRTIINHDITLNLNEASNRRAALQLIFKFARRNKLSAAEKDDLAANLARQLGVDYDALLDKRILQLMNPAEVAQISAEGVDVQLHTHRHRAPINHDLFFNEIEKNRRVIYEMTAASAAHFCYPNGNIHPNFSSWLKELNIVSATTCIPGLASRTSNELFLPRLVDGSMLAPIEFEGWLTGIASILPRRPKIFGGER